MGPYLRLINSCITQLKAQGPSRTCNESNEEERRNQMGEDLAYSKMVYSMADLMQEEGFSCRPSLASTRYLVQGEGFRVQDLGFRV